MHIFFNIAIVENISIFDMISYKEIYIDVL